MPNPQSGHFLRKALKDPLVHFLILGGLLFLVVSLQNLGKATENTIHITSARQQHIAILFEATWQRKPTPNELQHLVEDYIKEEIYYREALALGLDKNDTIVRRRMRQKLEFMQEDFTALTPPSEVELRTFFNEHKEQYQTSHILSFLQVLLSQERLNTQAQQIDDVRTSLNAGLAPDQVSQTSLLPTAMKMETETSIINTFGSEFMAGISELAPGAWQGPIYSGFGTHLVRVQVNQLAKPLSFDQARPKLTLEYTQSTRKSAAEKYYNTLRSQYHITIESAVK